MLLKNLKRLLGVVVSVVWLFTACNQRSQPTETSEPLSVDARMAKARAGKAQKQDQKRAGTWIEGERATPSDYRTPVDKVLKRPNGEIVRTGERGAPYYINKNGNKTYLSSNQ